MRTDLALRLLLGGVFVAAGALKMADPAGFAVSIARLRAVPFPLIGPAAILVPGIEIAAGAALWAPSLRRASLAVLLGMLGAFTAELLLALALGASSCGCLGGETRIDVALLRNAVLIAVALYLSRPSAQSMPRVISST